MRREEGDETTSWRGHLGNFEAINLACRAGVNPSLRQIADTAREFGAESLFNPILPLLIAPTLEDQERHLLVKVIDRVLYKLDDLVRPYVHKILVVIEPLLIDEGDAHNP